MAKTQLTSAYMDQISKAFSKVFNDALQNSSTDYLSISTEIASSTMIVDYRWMGDLPNLKEWVGDRVLKTLSMFDYSIKKKDWEATIEVHRDVIEYDNLGIVKPRIQGLAETVGMHYNQLIWGLLEQNSTCYDGKAFFAVDHPVGSVNMSNLGDKALSEESFMKARSEVRGVTDEAGNPLGINPKLLVVPPELEGEALKILKAQYKAGGESSITYGMSDLLVCQFLKDPKAWYLFDVTRSLKPLILQINKRPEFSALDKADSYANFMKKSLYYGIDTEDNAGYGLWQLAYKSSGTAV